MLAFLLMFLMLLAPVGLWLAGDNSWGLVALYVVLSLPSMIQITIDSIKNRHWPSIVDGPRVSFGRWGRHK